MIYASTVGKWPKECENDSYPTLEKFICLGCHPDQPKYTDTSKKIVRVCESLLREYYGNDNLDERTRKFKKCGGWSSPDVILKPIDINDQSKGYEVTQDDPVLIVPYGHY